MMREAGLAGVAAAEVVVANREEEKGKRKLRAAGFKREREEKTREWETERKGRERGGCCLFFRERDAGERELNAGDEEGDGSQ